MLGTKKITREMIDGVFAKPKLRKRIPNPKRAKAICEARLSGMTYTDIGNQYGLSQTTCVRCVHLVVRLYGIFVEGEKT